MAIAWLCFPPPPPGGCGAQRIVIDCELDGYAVFLFQSRNRMEIGNKLNYASGSSQSEKESTDAGASSCEWWFFLRRGITFKLQCKQSISW